MDHRPPLPRAGQVSVVTGGAAGLGLAIAEALARCSDAAWVAIGDLFLRAHYAPRLASVAICPKCGARNDVDAPYEREFEPALKVLNELAEHGGADWADKALFQIGRVQAAADRPADAIEALERL